MLIGNLGPQSFPFPTPPCGSIAIVLVYSGATPTISDNVGNIYNKMAGHTDIPSGFTIDYYQASGVVLTPSIITLGGGNCIFGAFSFKPSGLNITDAQFSVQNIVLGNQLIHTPNSTSTNPICAAFAAIGSNVAGTNTPFSTTNPWFPVTTSQSAPGHRMEGIGFLPQSGIGVKSMPTEIDNVTIAGPVLTSTAIFQ